MSKCKECVSEQVCRYNDGINLYCKEDYECPHFKNKADVVEVVRCKDCKHATFYSCRNDSCYKGIICEYEIGTTDENFFCSYGEGSDT